MNTRWFVRNALLAAAYAAIGLTLPATALANYRLSTALYVLAAWNPGLIWGLAVGNGLAGLPQGPVDMLLGFGVGLLTSWACAKLGTTWAPLAVLVIPSVIVPLWLGLLFHVPYGVVFPVVALGQAVSAVLAVALLRSRTLEGVIRS